MSWRPDNWEDIKKRLKKQWQAEGIISVEAASHSATERMIDTIADAMYQPAYDKGQAELKAKGIEVYFDAHGHFVHVKTSPHSSVIEDYARFGKRLISEYRGKYGTLIFIPEEEWTS